MIFLNLKNSSAAAALAVTSAAFVSMPVAAIPNNAPSFNPGSDTVTSPCEGVIRLSPWAQNVTDGDGEVSGLSFLITGTTNADIFTILPFVSWPSLTLSYQIKPGTPGGVVSSVSAVLIDTSGTRQGGQDTSIEQTWTITSEGCTDVDLDGIADEIDPEITPLVDSDGDGIFDLQDDDDDNDGILDIDEGNGLLDTDADGIADSLDTDSDDDGILDADETGDSDQDGIGDSQEPNGTDVTTDTDGDGITDDVDTDDDGDGIADVDEGNGTVDTDGDSIPDSLDPDSDNDGIGDNGTPVDDTTDTDGDGITDGADTDDDGDGIADEDEGDGAVDTDGDGIPDSLDLDSDNDGIGDDGTPVDDTPVTPQAGDTDPVLETGIRGVGAAFDPLLLLTGFLVLLGRGRRRA